MTPVERPPGRRAVRLVRLAVNGLLPLVIIAGSAYGGLQMMASPPKAERRAPERLARLVEVVPVEIAARAALVEAMGTVRAARSITLQPRVAGPVIAVSPEFVPGGLFRAGDEILRLDPTDHDLVVQQRQAALDEARAKLITEQGQQEIARREFDLLGTAMTDDERRLVLRGPQLATVRAAIAAAEAGLRQARLDRERTRVAAPFDAVVETRDVDRGAQVSATTRLATLIGTDIFWVEALVPTDRLKWIDIPRRGDDPGSPVRIHNDAAWGAGAARDGRVVRMLSGVEEQGRMARLLIAVDDPLALRPENTGRPSLLIGTYVRVEIEGVGLGPAVVLPRRLLRDGDTVWLMDREDKLEIRPLEVIYRGRDWVMVADRLAAGTRLVASDLTTPVAGMDLRVTEDGGDGANPGKAAAR